MQSILSLPEPPALPAAPLWERLLFEQPLASIAAAILALSAILLLARGATRTVRIVGAGLLPLALVFVAVPWLVETDREAINRHARGLAEAAAAGRFEVLERDLAHDARAVYFEARLGIGKEAIIERLRQYFGEGGRIDLSVLSVRSGMDGPRIGRAHIKVRVQARETGGFPNLSWWRLDWRKLQDGGWQCNYIEPLSITGIQNPGGR